MIEVKGQFVDNFAMKKLEILPGPEILVSPYCSRTKEKSIQVFFSANTKNTERTCQQFHTSKFLVLYREDFQDISTYASYHSL